MDHDFAQRPINSQELRLARALIGPPPAATVTDLYLAAFFQSALAVGLIGALAYFVTGNWPVVRANLWLGLIVVFLVIFLAAYRRSSEQEEERRRRQRRLEEELASGMIEAARFHAVEAIQIQSEPPAFLLLLGNGQAVPLRSYLEGRHPNTDFEVVRLPVSKTILCCPTFGQEIPIVAELPEQADSNIRPEGEAFPIDWQACKRGDVVL